jgi:glycosyltransferase involved in cell wall biosynthesis
MTVDCRDTDPISKVASSGKVFDRGCGFLTEANCSLTEIEGPWWILDAKIQRPADRWGTHGLRIRVGGREVHLERPDVDASGIAHFRHLLKLPMGDCTIRLDWIEEGMSTQQILQKECHVKGGSRIAQEKILAHPVDGQTDMTVMPKYGFWRQLEKKIRNYRKVISAKFNKKYKQNNPRKVKHLVFSSELNRKSLGRKLYVDITPIMENARADGVACVTKAVLSRILGSHEHGFEVIPVYSAEKGGGYFQAQFAAEKKNKWEMTAQRNPAIEPQDGDIFLGLGLNQRGVCDHLSLLLRWADQGVSILFYVYDLLPIQYPHFWPLEAQSDILHHEWLSIVTAFDEVICISETTARRCREFMDEKYAPRFRYKNRLNRSPVHLPSKKAKISSIPLGSDFDAELQSRGLPENAEGLLANFRSKRTFLMVGTLEPRKAHAQILQAFDQMWAKGSKDQLVIVGREGWLMHDFVQQLKSHRLLGSKLFWFRDASDEYLKRIYNASTCLIAASYDEGFGLPLVEAARFGKPIIARDIEIHREVAGRNALYFKGCDIEEIYHKIEEWEKLYNADQHPKSNIDSRTWEQHAEQLVENIKILVKERSRDN